ncbi:MAG: sulfatase-like hydrolase/transferase [Gammaproteobacteria bacterium]|nr:sulfatase-like hydrolase/transferase [Gammaproteobacteria bacterium]
MCTHYCPVNWSMLSRNPMMTGVDSHRNGVTNIPESIPPEQMAYDHYQGVLSDKVVTLASLLQADGYHTHMAGKWHLGHTPSLLPSAQGLVHSLCS